MKIVRVCALSFAVLAACEPRVEEPVRPEVTTAPASAGSAAAPTTPATRAATTAIAAPARPDRCIRATPKSPDRTLARDGGVPLLLSDQNESAENYPQDRDRWNEAWRRPDVVGALAFHNAVQGAPQRPLFEDDGFLVFARGDRGLVALNKTSQWQHPRVWTGGLRHGRYRCQLHQHDMEVGGEVFGFAIPPREAQLWLHQWP